MYICCLRVTLAHFCSQFDILKLLISNALTSSRVNALPSWTWSSIGNPLDLPGNIQWNARNGVVNFSKYEPIGGTGNP